MEFIHNWAWEIIIVLCLNFISHIFLRRFFNWYENGVVVTSGSFFNILLIPPLAFIVAVVLVGVGLLINNTENKDKEK